MKRFSAILLLCAFAALGSGAMRYAHELAHAAADDAHGHPAFPHDESNCFTHAQLKLPMLGAGQLPMLVFAGLFVAFITPLATPARSCRPVLLLDCRGPPATGE